MSEWELSTDSNLIMPLGAYDGATNGYDNYNLGVNLGSGSGKIIACPTLALAFFLSSYVFDITGYNNNFPTTNLSYHAAEHLDIVSSIKEPFTFDNRKEVLAYIDARSDLFNLYKSLHVMIESVFGSVDINLSVFRDYDEDWDTLRVEVKSNHGSEDLLKLEDQLFALIEEDSSFVAALEYVTISFG